MCDCFSLYNISFHCFVDNIQILTEVSQKTNWTLESERHFFRTEASSKL